MFALTLPLRLPNFCSAIRATLGQRQFRQTPCLALNAHSGNEWGKIPVLTGKLVSLICSFVVTFITRPPRIPVLKVTNFGCFLGKIQKIAVLELGLVGRGVIPR